MVTQAEMLEIRKIHPLFSYALYLEHSSTNKTEENIEDDVHPLAQKVPYYSASTSNPPPESVLQSFPGDNVPLTEDELNALFFTINSLPSRLFNRILDFLLLITPESVLMDQLTRAVEIDLDTMTTRVQRHLQRYVNQCVLVINYHC